jgi:hypothetical protein
MGIYFSVTNILLLFLSDEASQYFGGDRNSNSYFSHNKILLLITVITDL